MFQTDSLYHYWPGAEGTQQTYGKVSVRKILQENRENFIVRKFEVEEKRQMPYLASVKTGFTVIQLQLLVWPELESPLNASSIIELVEHVNKVQMGSGNHPVIVMCK